MLNHYSVDFKLKIVKMILNEHIAKKEIMRTYNVADGWSGSGYITYNQSFEATGVEIKK
jgi:transposase-like protein